jgi:hypothetical protein
MIKVALILAGFGGTTVLAQQPGVSGGSVKPPTLPGSPDGGAGPAPSVSGGAPGGQPAPGGLPGLPGGPGGGGSGGGSGSGGPGGGGPGGGSGGSGGGIPTTGAAKNRPAPGSLAEQLDLALKHNADIKFAEAKVREAEAELQRTRQQVLGRVSALHAEIQAHKESLKILQDALKQHEDLVKTGAVPTSLVLTARSNVAKAQIELAKVEGELQALVGSVGVSKSTTSKLQYLEMERPVRLWDLDGGKIVYHYAVPTPQVGTANVQQPMADRVRKMLGKTFKIPQSISDQLQQQDFKDSLTHFWTAIQTDVPIRFLAPSIAAAKVQLMTGELPVGAWLQMYEDSVPDVRFVVREYGILVTTKDKVPQGAIAVQDFWRRKEIAIPGAATTTPAQSPSTTGVKETIKQ